MVHYRRMGEENMVWHLGNTTSTTSIHHLRYLWKSPRGTVLRIQTLAVAAIVLTFFLVAFGSCRRWSSRWIVQKGFFAAQALSLSLGTYSIGLMQSSSVRSEMYPIWTVSLFALFGCIDPVSTYNGFDYKGPLSKVVYAICLYCGYVLLMSISGLSSVFGNTAICMLAAITFIKGFHRTLALVQQSRMRNLIARLGDDYAGQASVLQLQYPIGDTATSKGDLGAGGPAGFIPRTGGPGFHPPPPGPHFIPPPTGFHYLPPGSHLIVEAATGGATGMGIPIMNPYVGVGGTIIDPNVRIKDVAKLLNSKKKKGGIFKNNEKDDELQSCYDACVAYSLSHSLQRHFLGLSSRKVRQILPPLMSVDYKWALKVVEMELAFLHDIFFTGNSFLHYYQAKTACLWALASFTGICFVGVAAATPGAIASSRGGSTNVVDTTTADLVVTFTILVSLALLQMVQLLRCWTSNWARLAVVCAYARNAKRSQQTGTPNNWQKLWRRLDKFKCGRSNCWASCWMGLRWFVATRTNWFDKHYLWQEKIGQYAMLPEGEKEAEDWVLLEVTRSNYRSNRGCGKMLGLDYIWEVLWDLLGSDTDKRGDVRLHKDVKESITDFLCQIKDGILEGSWSTYPGHSGIEAFLLPYSYAPQFEEPQGSRYTRCVLAWCVATWHCELAEQEQEPKKREGNVDMEKGGDGVGADPSNLGNLGAGGASAGEGVAGVGAGTGEAAGAAAAEGEAGTNENRNHRLVAIALAKYCAYLVVSLPELLPGLVLDTKMACDYFATTSARSARPRDRDGLLKQVLDPKYWQTMYMQAGEPVLLPRKGDGFRGAASPQTLDDIIRGPDCWKTLAAVWVRMLVYAAPYGNAEVHMRQLAQGGEFITHLWALLYHLCIREWKPPGSKKPMQLGMGGPPLPRQPQPQPQPVGPGDLINTADDAQRIIQDFSQDSEAVVVAFLHSQFGYYSDELRAASKLEKRVSFYRTTSTSPEIAKLFGIEPAAKRPSLVLLLTEDQGKKKFTSYGGEFKRYAIADFVSVNKLPLVTKFTQKAVSSLDDHPIHKMIVLFADAKESSKLLPDFEEAAKDFRGKLLFVFVAQDNKEDEEAASDYFAGLDSWDDDWSTCTGQETKVLAYTRKDEIKIPYDGEVSLDTIKKLAQDFHEDKVYLSEPPDVKIVVGNKLDQIVLDESKDVLLVIYEPDASGLNSCMAACNKLAKHLGGIESLVIAKMDCTTNWHPHANKDKGMMNRGGLWVLFYPATKKNYEPIIFNGKKSVKGLYKFIKDHAVIKFEAISTLEEDVSTENGGPTHVESQEEIPQLA